MNIKISSTRHNSKLGVLLLILSALAIVVIACGTDDSSSFNDEIAAAGSSGTQKIIVNDRIYTIADLVTAGFKKSKTYDVDGLEAAVSAHYGFYGKDPYDRQEYEVRFYASHADAVAIGASWADEASGKDAVVLKDIQRWDEGLKERRQCAGNGGHHSGKCDNAKYGDYMIAGNMVLMCEGKTSGDALETCQALLAIVS